MTDLTIGFLSIIFLLIILLLFFVGVIFGVKDEFDRDKHLEKTAQKRRLERIESRQIALKELERKMRL